MLARDPVITYRWYEITALTIVPELWHGSHHHGNSRRWISNPTRLRCLSLKTPLSLTPKEIDMQYKTIILQYLRQRPRIHNELKSRRVLLPTLDKYAIELKCSHEAWKARLSEENSGSDPSQLASQALEIALKEWMNSLPQDESPNENEPLSLHAAIAYLRRHTPTA
jgi:hypothetical protein